jgi:hypothetical protein
VVSLLGKHPVMFLLHVVYFIDWWCLGAMFCSVFLSLDRWCIALLLTCCHCLQFGLCTFRPFLSISWDSIMYLVFSVFTSRPTLLLASIKVCVSLYGIYGHREMLEVYPYGDRVEYLHRDPASLSKRRKLKSQVWDSKIWSRVQKDSNTRKTALARASGIYRRQNRHLVSEGAPQNQDRNCQTGLNICSWAPDGARYQDLLTDSPSVAMRLWLWLRSRGSALECCSHWSRCETVSSQRGQESLNTKAEKSTFFGTVTKQRPMKMNWKN